LNIEELVKSPKFRHACEGRHPELLEKLDSRLRGNDVKERFKTFYEIINIGIWNLFGPILRSGGACYFRFIRIRV